MWLWLVCIFKFVIYTDRRIRRAHLIRLFITDGAMLELALGFEIYTRIIVYIFIVLVGKYYDI